MDVMRIVGLPGVAVLLSAPAIAPGAAQVPDHAAAQESRERVAALDWLVAEWEGSGWIMVPGAGRQEFTSSEVVETRLEGRVLIVEGLHRDATGDVVHNALGAITWDAAADAFVFHTWLGTQGGGGVDNPLELTDGGFRWMPVGTRAGTTTVFDVRIEDGEWIETGTVTLPDGQSIDFFEMRLRKTSG